MGSSDSEGMIDAADLSAWFLRAIAEHKGLIGEVCPGCLRTVPEEGSVREGGCQCGTLTTPAQTAEVLGLPPDWFIVEQMDKKTQAEIIR